jgi:hypothetical protein
MDHTKVKFMASPGGPFRSMEVPRFTFDTPPETTEDPLKLTFSSPIGFEAVSTPLYDNDTELHLQSPA